MADLDDFFAKKDKKKSKSKKFVTSELKQLEVVSKEKEQKNIENESTEGATTNENNDENDEEWGEFEESKRPDLSNLKLGQLTFDEEQHNQNAGGADNESENTSQFNNDGDSSENPWKKAQENAGKEQNTVTAVPESKPGVYVPRFGGESSTKARKKNAPDLKSEGMFPSLGTDKPVNEQVKNKKDGFKEVTHGIKKDQQSASTNFQIPLSATVYSSLFNNEVDS